MFRFAIFMKRSISRRFSVLDPGEAKLSAPGLRPRHRHQLADGVGRELGIRDEDARDLGDEGDRDEVLQRVHGQVAEDGAGLIAIVPMLPRKIV